MQDDLISDLRFPIPASNSLTSRIPTSDLHLLRALSVSAVNNIQTASLGGKNNSLHITFGQSRMGAEGLTLCCKNVRYSVGKRLGSVFYSMKTGVPEDSGYCCGCRHLADVA